MHQGFRSVLRNRGFLALAVVAVLSLEVLAGVLIFARERESRREEEERIASNPIPDVWSNGLLGHAIDLPEIVGTEEARIGSEDEVIGIEVGGKARAYHLKAFEKPSGHLVNDLIGGVPVSVVYCNLTDCVRVYTEAGRARPLELEVAGLIDGEMILKVEGRFFYQKSGRPVGPAGSASSIPYRPLEPTRTTWAEWRRDNPETDVYIGDRRAPQTATGLRPPTPGRRGEGGG